MLNEFEKDAAQGVDPIESDVLEAGGAPSQADAPSLEAEWSDPLKTEPEQPLRVSPREALARVSAPKNDAPRAQDPPRYDYRWSYAGYQRQEKTQTKPRKHMGLRVLAIVMAGVFVLTFAAFAGVFTAKVVGENLSSKKAVLTDSPDQASGVNAPPITGGQTVSTIRGTPGIELSIPEIAAKCQPSSVGIVTNTQSVYGFTSSGVGSGFIYSADGYIVTNHHVIQNAKEIKVVLHDNTEVEAELIGSDSLSDLAVLKIERNGLTAMEIGNSDELVVGELAVAIGSPAGIEYTGTVTDGIISGINRNVEIYDNYGRVQKTMTLIQTNATVNRGNSGGPLINRFGQVIGINTLKLTSDFEGIGFSIPINGALPVITQLIEKGEVLDREAGGFVSGTGSIGITQYADISAGESAYYEIPQGVFVIQLSRDSNAAKAGLRRGDIIIKYNGEPVKSAAEINALKSKDKAGDEVTITVYRDEEGELDLSFRLNAAS